MITKKDVLDTVNPVIEKILTKVQTLTSGLRFKDMIPWWKPEHAHERLIEHLAEKKIPFTDWNKFFTEQGVDVSAIVEKMSIEVMKSKEFRQMSDPEKVMIGKDCLDALMARIFNEILENSQREETQSKIAPRE